MKHLKNLMGNIMSKKGSEMVEAAIVIPIIILTFLSMIMLIIYFYSCLICHVDLEYELIKKERNSNAIFERLQETEDVSKKIGGAVLFFMRKEYDAEIYCLNETKMIRLGEFLDENL